MILTSKEKFDLDLKRKIRPWPQKKNLTLASNEKICGRTDQNHSYEPHIKNKFIF
jgi:hypothetical protein